MTESDRDKTIEVMARGLCAEEYGREDMWDLLPETEAEAFRQKRAGTNPSIGYREEFRDSAEAALTALQASGMAVVAGWQPIESAPKDGTRIILAWGGAAVTGSYLDNGHTAYPWKGWRVPSLELTPPGAPVAWMPFPAVPANVS